MKTIGLLGGMSWESTETYYRYINEHTRKIRGKHHSAPIAMVSVDFEEIKALQYQNNWQSTAEILSQKAKQVENAGADLLLICTNTMHKVADQIQAAINIPVLHLADATAEEIKKQGHQTTALLGTRFTMEQDFYKARLTAQGLNVLIPNPQDIDIIHNVIYEELTLGKINPGSRTEYLRIIDTLTEQGAQSIIAGCTEIGLLIQQQHLTTPLYDTTKIHAEQAVIEALKT